MPLASISPTGIGGFQPESHGEVGVEAVGDASPVVRAVELDGVAYLARYL